MENKPFTRYTISSLQLIYRYSSSIFTTLLPSTAAAVIYGGGRWGFKTRFSGKTWLTGTLATTAGTTIIALLNSSIPHHTETLFSSTGVAAVVASSLVALNWGIFAFAPYAFLPSLLAGFAGKDKFQEERYNDFNKH